MEKVYALTATLFSILRMISCPAFDHCPGLCRAEQGYGASRTSAGTAKFSTGYNASGCGMSLTPAGVLKAPLTGFGGQFKFTVRLADVTGETDENLIALTAVSSLVGRRKAKARGCEADESTGSPIGLMALMLCLATGVRFH